MVRVVCDNCGREVDEAQARKPPKWWSLSNDDEADLCSLACLIEWGQKRQSS